MRFRYYFSQSAYNLRRSALTILGLSLAISMVAGLNYYNDAIQSQIIENSFIQVLDYEFEVDNPSLDVSGNFGAEREQYESLLRAGPRI